MDVLLPELLREALAQRAHAELARREPARPRVAAQRGRRARKDERAALPAPVDLVLLELEDDAAGERERRGHVHLQLVCDVLLGDVEEALKHSRGGVPNPDAEVGGPFVGPLVREDGVEYGERGLVRVVRDRECCCLRCDTDE